MFGNIALSLYIIITKGTRMENNINGAKAQMPVSAPMREFIAEYEADMAYSGAPEYSEFTRLRDAEKLNWIKVNDTKAYDYFEIYKERFA